jgi:hypothetical protein
MYRLQCPLIRFQKRNQVLHVPFVPCYAYLYNIFFQGLLKQFKKYIHQKTHSKSKKKIHFTYPPVYVTNIGQMYYISSLFNDLLYNKTKNKTQIKIIMLLMVFANPLEKGMDFY